LWLPWAPALSSLRTPTSRSRHRRGADARAGTERFEGWRRHLEIVVFSHLAPGDRPCVRGQSERAHDGAPGPSGSGDRRLRGTAVVSAIRIVSKTTTHYDIGLPREQSPFVAQNGTGGRHLRPGRPGRATWMTRRRTLALSSMP
jgi:hypothetical protein